MAYYQAVGTAIPTITFDQAVNSLNNVRTVYTQPSNTPVIIAAVGIGALLLFSKSGRRGR